MSDWRVERHYGFGAGRVVLSPEPHRYPQSIGAAIRDAGGDFYLSSLPPVILAAFMCAALFVTVSEDRGYTDLEVVMVGRDFDGIPEEVEPLPPVAPEPPPVQEIAEKKPEPPPEKVVKKIAPPKPPPVQKIAAAKPKPRPVAKPKPKPRSKPKLGLAAIAPVPKTKVPPPQRRTQRAAPAPVKPKFALMPKTAPALALAPVEEEASRSRRFAAVRQTPSSKRPKADLGPPIAARALTAPPPEGPPVRSRRSSKRAPAAAPRRVAPIDFAAAAAAPTPAAPARQAPERRSNRPTAQANRSRRAAPPPSIQPALAAAAPSRVAPQPETRVRERDRTQRNDSTRRRSDRSEGGQLQGVPLASLAACLSDREEDALKRRLVAAVTTQRECVSAAGTYRFIETKNLNAFLMTIERPANRAVADRCVELSHALECVRN